MEESDLSVPKLMSSLKKEAQGEDKLRVAITCYLKTRLCVTCRTVCCVSQRRTNPVSFLDSQFTLEKGTHSVVWLSQFLSMLMYPSGSLT